MVNDDIDRTAAYFDADPPLVSIGVPVRNGAEHLAEALESICAQDYQRFEVIVSDNASEDGTDAIAKRFASADPRFRFTRNSSDIGFLPNFRRVLDQATGTYFTWLAHDDLLSDPSYLSTAVEYLERQPDVVVCSTAFYLSPFELAESGEVRYFPELHPDLWPRSRRELFRWPHGWLDLTIYGVFRRAELANVPIPNRSFKGRPHIFWWETELLTTLSATGRVIALPQCLRSYRRSTRSAGSNTVAEVSTFDLMLLGLQIKMILIRRALTLPVPPFERLGLLATALGNLLKANFRLPYDHRREVRSLEREIAMLQRVSLERSELVSSLRSAIEQRQELARARGFLEESFSSEPSSSPLLDVESVTSSARSRSFLADFFQPPQKWQIEHYQTLSRRLSSLRDECARQLQYIEQLHEEAARLSRALQPTEPGQL